MSGSPRITVTITGDAWHLVVGGSLTAHAVANRDELRRRVCEAIEAAYPDGDVWVEDGSAWQAVTVVTEDPLGDDKLRDHVNELYVQVLESYSEEVALAAEPLEAAEQLELAGPARLVYCTTGGGDTLVLARGRFATSVWSVDADDVRTMVIEGRDAELWYETDPSGVEVSVADGVRRALATEDFGTPAFEVGAAGWRVLDEVATQSRIAFWSSGVPELEIPLVEAPTREQLAEWLSSSDHRVRDLALLRVKDAR